jgi:hypothetical protein
MKRSIDLIQTKELSIRHLQRTKSVFGRDVNAFNRILTTTDFSVNWGLNWYNLRTAKFASKS